MTVPAEGSRVVYNGNGVTTAFSFGKAFQADTDLNVWLVNADGVATAQTLNVHYTVTGAGNPAGGTVTFMAAPASGLRVLIVRDTDAVQTGDLDNVASFDAESIEAMHDRAMLLINEVQERIDRTVRLPDSDASTGLSALPPREMLRGRVLFFDDATGDVSPQFPAVLNGSGTGPSVRVDTVADLRAATTSTVNDSHVEVMSWHAASIYPDKQRHGGGLFALDASDVTSTDNGWSVIVDAVGRRWKRVNRLRPEITWFGIKGDGSDETALMQSIVAMMNITSTTHQDYIPDPAIFVPPGFYIGVSAAIGRLTRSGAGFYGGETRNSGITMLQNPAETEGHLIAFGHDTMDQVAENQIFSGLIVRSENEAYVTGARHMIEFDTTKDMIFEDVEINGGLCVRIGDGTWADKAGTRPGQKFCRGLRMRRVRMFGNKGLPGAVLDWRNSAGIALDTISIGAVSRSLLRYGPKSYLTVASRWTVDNSGSPVGSPWATDGATFNVNISSGTSIARTAESVSTSLVAGQDYEITLTSLVRTGSLTVRLTDGAGTYNVLGTMNSRSFSTRFTHDGVCTFLELVASGNCRFSINSIALTRGTHPQFTGFRVGPTALGGNIDSAKVSNMNVNAPNGYRVAGLFDTTYDDIGNISFDTCFFELAREGCAVFGAQDRAAMPIVSTTLPTATTARFVLSEARFINYIAAGAVVGISGVPNVPDGDYTVTAVDGVTSSLTVSTPDNSGWGAPGGGGQLLKACGRTNNLMFMNCRATSRIVPVSSEAPAFLIDDPHGTRIEVQWSGGWLSGSRGPILKAVNYNHPNAYYSVRLTGTEFRDRFGDSIAPGGGTTMCEVGLDGVSIIGCYTTRGFEDDTLMTYGGRYERFLLATADLNRLTVVGNDLTALTGTEVIDVSAISGLMTKPGVVIASNSGNTSVDTHKFFDDGGAIGDGVANDSAAIQSVLNAGRVVRLDPSKIYRIGTQITFPSNNLGIEGNGTRVIISGAAGHFNNDNRTNRYAANAVPFLATGKSGVFLRNCRIEYEWAEYRHVRALRWTDCADIDISGNEFKNFVRGAVVSLSGCVGGSVKGNWIHHCYTNSKFMADGATIAPVSEVQVTAISLDDDGTNGSADLHVFGNLIEWITVGNAVLLEQGYQADGINIQGPGNHATGKTSRRITIIGNTVRYTGDGIDCFGRDCIMQGNQVEWCFNTGFKLTHGASFNKIVSNNIKECGLSGVFLSGSSSVPSAFGDNEVLNNTIQNVNRAYDDDGSTPLVWMGADGAPVYTPGTPGDTYWTNVYNPPSGTKTAGIRIDVPTSGSPYQIDRTRIAGNNMRLGGNADFAVFCETGSGQPATVHHVYPDNLMTGAKAVYQDNGNRLYIYPGHRHRIRQISAHTLDNTTSAQPAFNVPSDNGEFNAKAKTRYRFRCQIQMSNLSSSSGDVSFGFGGTATYTRAAFITISKKSGGAGSNTMREFNTTTPTPVSVVSANTSTAAQIVAEGILVVNNAGTVVPQVALGVAIGTATVNNESFFEIWEDNHPRPASGDFS